MFSNEKKESFHNKDFNMSSFLSSSKYKLTQLNDLKWINYFSIQITFIQLIFFGLFSYLSLTIIVLQLYLSNKIYTLFRDFPVYDSSQIDKLSSEVYGYANFVQFTFLINIVNLAFFIFQITNPIGIEMFSGPNSNKFYIVAVTIEFLRLSIIFLIRLKIHRVNLRAEIINDLY